MSSLKPPFSGTSHMNLALKIKEGVFERLPMRYSEELQRVISCMLNVDYEARPSVDDLIKLPQITLRIREIRLREN